MDTSPHSDQTPQTPQTTDPDWLDAATVAVSPLGDVLAAATERRVVLMAGKGGSGKESVAWVMIW